MKRVTARGCFTRVGAEETEKHGNGEYYVVVFIWCERDHYGGRSCVCGISSEGGQVWMFASLSFTALTVCALYSDAARRVVNEDWGGLMDIMPTMAGALWVCVIASILMNGFAWRAGSKERRKRAEL